MMFFTCQVKNLHDIFNELNDTLATNHVETTDIFRDIDASLKSMKEKL